MEGPQAAIDETASRMADMAAASAAGVSAAEAEVARVEELVRLRGLTAEEAERERISRERQAIIEQALAGYAGSGFSVDATNARIEAARLAEEYEAAAIAASEILNPVKAVAVASAGAADSIEDVVGVVQELSPLLSRLGMDAEAFNGIMSKVEASMESAFMSMIDGTSSASDAFKSMASEIIKELYRVLVVKQITGFVTDAVGLATGQTGFFDGLAGAPVAARASGGSVRSGQGYMVGEHGPEPFIPAQNGRILSVAQSQAAMSGGGGGVTVIQNNTFGNGVNRAEINAMMPKMVEASKAAVLDAKRRGGSYGSAF
jgi:hypothetical protein